MHQHQHLSMLPQPSGCGDLYHSNPAEYLLRTNPIQRRDHPGAAILSQQFIKNEPNSTPQPSRHGDLYHGNPVEYLLRTNPIQSRTFHLTALPCASQARPAKEKNAVQKNAVPPLAAAGPGRPQSGKCHQKHTLKAPQTPRTRAPATGVFAHEAYWHEEHGAARSEAGSAGE